MPITDYIRSEIAICMQEYDACRLIERFQDFFSLASSRGMSGAIFENICHRHFKKQILIEYIPMVRFDENDKRRKPKWHSSHHPIDIGAVRREQLEDRRQGALGNLKTLDVRPSGTCELEYDGQAISLEQDVYYIPMKSNDVAFDSFIRHDDYLYIFQFTVSENHGIDPGLIPRLTLLADCTDDLPPRENWLFIFIIPDGLKALTCPYPDSPELQKLEPFSSQVVMKDLAKSIAPQQSVKEGEDEHVHKKLKKTEEAAAQPSRRSKRQNFYQ
jgi:hypothetical protein